MDVFDGWAMPPGSARFHWFRDGEALCRPLRYGGPVFVFTPEPGDLCRLCLRECRKTPESVEAAWERARQRRNQRYLRRREAPR